MLLSLSNDTRNAFGNSLDRIFGDNDTASLTSNFSQVRGTPFQPMAVASIFGHAHTPSVGPR
jgi:hypothetical protein